MIEFLISVLLFAFGLGVVDKPVIGPRVITEHIESKMPELDPPQENQEIFKNVPDFPEPGESDSSEPEHEDNQVQGSSVTEQDTTKVDTFNTKSEKYIGQVAAIAVENSEPLVSCDKEGEGFCYPDPEPTVEPIPPTPAPIIPLPIPFDPPVQDPHVLRFL